MAVHIAAIGNAMFAGKAKFLDLKTGRIMSSWLVDAKIASVPQCPIPIPMYSKTLIYQKYLTKLFDQVPFAKEFMFNYYPELEEMIQWYPDCDPYKYIDVAYHFAEEFDSQILYNRKHGTLPFDGSLQTFDEYSTEYKMCVAKEWCEKEGIEWYK